MNNLIASCGINCAECDARTATLHNDDKLREIVATNWRSEYGNPDFTPEMINCTGCDAEGVKFAHCAECEMRNCTHGKGYINCAECNLFDTCEIISGFHNFVPQAKENLLALRALK